MTMPKTITDIIPPSRRRAMEAPAQQTEAYEPPRKAKRSGGGGKFPYGLAIIAVIIIAICIAAMMLFAGATVKVTPMVSSTSVSGEWTAMPSTGELPFEAVTVTKTASQSVQAEGTENATVAAQGTVTIYNAQEKTQELIKNTRFETSDGKIFRIHDSVVVPSGSASSPGQLKATIYADAAGESYNVGPTTFTLPGLKGGELYDLVYAKSDAPMTGGFTGTRPSVKEATRTAQYEKLKGTLTSDLEAEIRSKVPEGYILVPGATFVAYTALPDAADTSSSVKVQYEGTATAFIFPNQALGKALAYRLVGKYNGEPIMVSDPAGLTLTPTGEGTPVPRYGEFHLHALWKHHS